MDAAARGHGLSLGATVGTGAGRLTSSHLVHVVVADGEDGRVAPPELRASAFARALDHARVLGVASAGLRASDLDGGDLDGRDVDGSAAPETLIAMLREHLLAPDSLETLVVGVTRERAPALLAALEAARVHAFDLDRLIEGRTAALRAPLRHALSLPAGNESADLILGLTAGWSERFEPGAHASLRELVRIHADREPPSDPVDARVRWRAAVRLAARDELAAGVEPPRQAAPMAPSRSDVRTADAPVERLAGLLASELSDAEREHLIAAHLPAGLAGGPSALARVVRNAPDLRALVRDHLGSARLCRLALEQAGTPSAHAHDPARCADDLLRHLGFVVPPAAASGLSAHARELLELRRTCEGALDPSTVLGAATQAASIAERVVRELLAFHAGNAYAMAAVDLVRQRGWLPETYTLAQCSVGKLLELARRLDRELQRGEDLGARRHRGTFGGRSLLPSGELRLPALRNRLVHDRGDAKPALPEVKRVALELFEEAQRLIEHLGSGSEPLLPREVVVVGAHVDRWGRCAADVVDELGRITQIRTDRALGVGSAYFLRPNALPALIPVRGE